MALWKIIITLMLIGYLTASLPGCGQENSAEHTGKAIDKIVDDAKQTGRNLTNPSTPSTEGNLERVKKKLNEDATQQ